VTIGRPEQCQSILAALAAVFAPVHATPRGIVMVLTEIGQLEVLTEIGLLVALTEIALLVA